MSDDEVNKAIFAMKPWKAPGPDKFPVGFYQNLWGIVGRKMCEFVKKVRLNSGGIDRLIIEIFG